MGTVGGKHAWTGTGDGRVASTAVEYGTGMGGGRVGGHVGKHGDTAGEREESIYASKHLVSTVEWVERYRMTHCATNGKQWPLRLLGH